MSLFTLRVYNVPTEKSEEEVHNTLSKAGTFAKLRLALKSDTENAGYAVVEFDSQHELDVFASCFPKLRKDLVIYKELD
jgi:hypothetical protein